MANLWPFFDLVFVVSFSSAAFEEMHWFHSNFAELYITVKYRSSLILVIIHQILAELWPFLSPAFSKKSGGTLFLVFHGAWCVVRDAWFWIFSRYFVPLTPPTVFVRSFWNFTGVLRMVWRCASGFFRILKLFFITLHILNLDIFWVLILQKSIGSRYLVPLTPPTVFGWSFWNFTWALRMAWRYACGFFSESWSNFLSLFPHF